MKTKGILLIACFALLLHDASSCGGNKNRENNPVPNRPVVVQNRHHQTPENVPKIPRFDINNYHFNKKLERFCEFKMAEHRETKDKFTIQIIDTEKLKETVEEVMKHEEEIRGMLKHENILNIFRSTNKRKKVYLLLEYANEGDLVRYLEEKKEKLNEEEARGYIRQIIEVVDYCHFMKVALGDLKIESFLLNGGDIKLGDFVMATKFKPNEKLQKFSNNKVYGAPEILLEKRYDGPKADVWSLGVILYLLVTSSLPEFRYDGTYNVPSHVTENCEKFMARFLIVDPRKRPTLRDIIISEGPNEWLNKGFEENKLQPYDGKKIMLK